MWNRPIYFQGALYYFAFGAQRPTLLFYTFVKSNPRNASLWNAELGDETEHTVHSYAAEKGYLSYTVEWC